MAISRQASGVSEPCPYHDPEEHEKDEEELGHQENHSFTSAMV